MRNKYIFWDLDGTIAKSDLGITKSVQKALEAEGIYESSLENLLCFVGPPLYESFTRLYEFNMEQYEHALDVFHDYYRSEGIYECELYKGIKELLTELKNRGHKLYIATSKPEPEAKRVIKYLGIEELFEYIGGSDDDHNGVRSTKALVIEYVLNECGIKDRDSVIMVGDKSHDVTGARKNGIDCVGVLYGYGSREELEESGAVKTAENMEELLHILDR